MNRKLMRASYLQNNPALNSLKTQATSLTISINRPPQNGSVYAFPLVGDAMSTEFRIWAVKWTVIVTQNKCVY